MAGEVQAEAQEMKVIESPIPSNIWLEYKSAQRMTVPEGFETKMQIAAKIGCKETQTKTFLKKLLSAGKIDVLVAPNGLKYYRPKDYGKTQISQKHRRNR